MTRFNDHQTICDSAPGKPLARIAVDHGSELEDRNPRLVLANARVAGSFFDRRDTVSRWQRRGVSTGFPRLLAEGARQTCRDGARETGTMLVSSQLLGFGDTQTRVAFGRRSLPEALGVLSYFVDRSGLPGRDD